MIQKQFPADTTLQKQTYLNDNKINGELYALYQELSYPVDGKTIVSKRNLPTQLTLCKMLGIKSPKTLRSHLNYLIQQKYIKILEDGSLELLLGNEKIFLMIPLETLSYLNDNCKDHVIKIYIYLGQRFKYKGSSYTFTLEELAEHCGQKINHNSKTYAVINNALDLLVNSGLIKYCSYYDGNTK